jgi:hypothetical protein
MPSTKLLRGLPVSLIESYMSTLCYYNKGYMADWLYNGMIELEINEVIIDVLNETIFPNEISIIPLKLNIPRLNSIIQRTLLSNGFDDGYIKSAKLLIKMHESFNKHLLCRAEIIDINNKSYASKEMLEKVYEEPFSIKDKASYIPFENQDSPQS